MRIQVILLSCLFSVLSTTIMSYIAMATPVGPWIAPLLMLIILFISSLLPQHIANVEIVAMVSAGSVGGILATGLGFAFPTYYFIDPQAFMMWIQSSSSFIGTIIFLCLCAGGLGIWIAYVFDRHFRNREHLSFPIGELLYEMLHVKEHIIKAYQLVIGFLGAFVFCFFKDGIGNFFGILPQSILVVPEMQTLYWQIPVIRLDLVPMWWAIGFISGSSVILPLLVGAISRVIVLDPLYVFWFTSITKTEFILAFCSGMAIYGAIYSFAKIGFKYMRMPHMPSFNFYNDIRLDHRALYTGLALSIGIYVYFAYYGFSLLSILSILLATFIFAYQVICIAGRIGIAPLGRYATFVMIPALVLFGLNGQQVSLLASFVEICCGVAVDILFSQKLAERVMVNRAMIYKYQVLGLIVSSITAGVVFYVLISRFGLGSEELFAYKAQARALIVDVQQCNMHGIFLGFMYAAGITFLNLNAMLVFGGLLMPINLSLGLAIGGFFSMIVQDKQAWEPFWSGIFAANSLWMVFRALI